MLKISNIEGTNFGTASNVYEVYNKEHDKNIFEIVVDNLILDKYSDDLELKDYIRYLPTRNKRVAILSVLGDDNVLWKQIKDLLDKELSSYERLRGVYNLLKEYVKIADVERKKHGEVHTPFEELAEPMVRLVEKYDKEFWKNKNHKVLDSSAGYGTFLILAAYKFMVGLKDEFPIEEERFKWIVENCLYYGELQAKSVFSWLVAIDPYDEYETNIYWGSFLSEDFDKHSKEVWGVEKFDLIIQNPPYQKSSKISAATDKPIWHLFVDKSMLLLSECGKMVMVHPSGWRSIRTFRNTKKKMVDKNMKYLKMHSFRDGQNMFNAAINFDYYLLENNNYEGTTKIICEDDSITNIDISEIEILPSENIIEISDLFAKEGEERVELISNSSYHTQRKFISKEESLANPYPCVYTVRTNHQPTIRWSSLNGRGHFGIGKVIFARGASGTICDETGTYGLTEFAYGIVDDVNNLERIKKVLDSEYFIKNIMLFKNSLGDRYNRKMIAQFRKDFWKEFI